MKVGIVGCGLIGNKRAMSLVSDELYMCVDSDVNRAHKLSHDYHCQHSAYYESATQNKNVDIVIVATPNNMLAEIAVDALEHGKHVLIEKPAGMNSREILKIIGASQRNDRKVWVGYNHRLHPAVMSAKSMILDGKIGEIMFCRGLYGHGGRKGMEAEWRSDIGELVDQGSHLIDLSSWFLDCPKWESVDGVIQSYFWNGYSDDNAFITLVNKNHQTAFLHASCTEWRNMFQFEIYGKLGKLRIDGLGGSYGVEKLTWYDMFDAEEFPLIQSWEYPQPDKSWHREWESFCNVIQHNLQPTSSIYNALGIMEVIEMIKEAQ